MARDNIVIRLGSGHGALLSPDKNLYTYDLAKFVFSLPYSGALARSYLTI